MFRVNPQEATAKNITKNRKVLLKITYADKAMDRWVGIFCFGSACFESNITAIRKGWELLGKAMNTAYAHMAAKFCRKVRPSPYLRVRINQMTGRCSAFTNETVP